MLRDPCWWDSGNHMWFQGSNSGQLHAICCALAQLEKSFSWTMLHLCALEKNMSYFYIETVKFQALVRVGVSEALFCSDGPAPWILHLSFWGAYTPVSMADMVPFSGASIPMAEGQRTHRSFSAF